MVYYTPDGKIETGNGEMKGKILFEREGKNGFGYDPIFYSYDLNKSMGIASKEEKNKISHRYKALMEIKGKIK